MFWLAIRFGAVFPARMNPFGGRAGQRSKATTWRRSSSVQSLSDLALALKVVGGADTATRCSVRDGEASTTAYASEDLDAGNLDSAAIEGAKDVFQTIQPVIRGKIWGFFFFVFFFPHLAAKDRRSLIGATCRQEKLSQLNRRWRAARRCPSSRHAGMDDPAKICEDSSSSTA